MPMIGYLDIEGERQGRIEGASAVGDHDGLIEIHELEHGLATRNDGSGVLSSAGVEHQAIVCVKPTDRTTPMLYQIMAEREPVRVAGFSWFIPAGAGGDELVYRLELGNARISSIASWMPNIVARENDRHYMLDRLTFTYERILWSWGTGGDTAFEAYWHDNWREEETNGE